MIYGGSGSGGLRAGNIIRIYTEDCWTDREMTSGQGTADGNFYQITVTEAMLYKATDLYSTKRAFAAKFTDGTVQAWGNSDYGGDIFLDPGEDNSRLQTPSMSNLVDIEEVLSLIKHLWLFKKLEIHPEHSPEDMPS